MLDEAKDRVARRLLGERIERSARRGLEQVARARVATEVLAQHLRALGGRRLGDGDPFHTAATS